MMTLVVLAASNNRATCTADLLSARRRNAEAARRHGERAVAGVRRDTLPRDGGRRHQENEESGGNN